jgi:hypothetical protein
VKTPTTAGRADPDAEADRLALGAEDYSGREDVMVEKINDGKPASSSEFEAILDLIMAGKLPLPNFEEISLERGVANIAVGGGLVDAMGVRNAKVPGSSSTWGHWSRYFLGTTQGGALDGTGYVIWWDRGNGHVGKFAICRHEKVTGSGADPRRGWHPGRCSKCGLDMTVDSGD